MIYPPMRSERPDIQRVIVNKPWCNSVDFCAIVKESHASLHVDSYSGYILDPVPFVKGVGIQERSLHLAFYAFNVPSWGTCGMVAFP